MKDKAVRRYGSRLGDGLLIPSEARDLPKGSLALSRDEECSPVHAVFSPLTRFLPRLLLPHHSCFKPRVLVPDHLLRDLIGRHVVVVEHRGKAVLYPAAGMETEQAGQLYRAKVGRVLLVHGVG